MILQLIAMGSVMILGILGEIIAERSGVVNLSIEGSIAMSAASAYAAAIYFSNSFIGLLIGSLSGIIPSLFLSLLSTYLPMNMIVVGITLSSIFSAVSIAIGNIVPRLPQNRILILSDDATIYFIFSISVALSIATYIMIMRRRIGLLMRSVGEDPYTALSMGINIWRIRTLSALISGFFGGLVGSLVILSPMISVIWREGVTSGLGYIIVAITPATLWNPLLSIPLGIFVGAISFLSILLQTSGILPISTDEANLIPYVIALVIYVFVRIVLLKKLIAVPKALAREIILEERYE